MMFTFESIGTLTTCFKEKFGIPRQSRLVEEARGILKLRDDDSLKNAVRSLKEFSHIWIVFVFHRHDAKNWKPSIRPPRLGGAKKVGVLASRSPHRPNPIGISVVRLDKIDLDAPNGVEIHVSGVDILDGTPVLDIKPYLPYADSVPSANSGWAEESIARIPIKFTNDAIKKIDRAVVLGHPNLKALIIGMLELDPRPAFQKRRLPASCKEAIGTSYGFRLFDYDVKWKIEEDCFLVLDLTDL
jgi:tRNA-Thr(GGU) m(6)t(6)A37 methyltransferase TsaA